jgi:WD40 repeat protein
MASGSSLFGWSLQEDGRMFDIDVGSPVTSLSVSPDGKWIAFAAERLEGVGRLDAESGFEATGAPGETGTTCLLWAPGGEQVWALRSDGALDRMAFKRGAESVRHELSDHAFVAAAVDRRGVLLVAAEERGGLLGVKLSNGTVSRTFEDYGGAVHSVAFHPEDPLFAAGSKDGKVRLYSASKAQPRRVLVGHGASVLSVAFDASGEWLASGDSQGEVRIWDAKKGKLIATLARSGEPGDAGRAEALAFHPDGSLLVVVGLGYEATLWDLGELRQNWK